MANSATKTKLKVLKQLGLFVDDVKDNIIFEKPRKKLGEVIRFAGAFARYPRRVGALMPSSPALATAMVRGLRWNKFKSVLEYGCGTGAITRAITTNLSSETKFIAIEANRKFGELFAATFPDVNLQVDTVANVRNICNAAGIDEVDCIISSLPWAAFSAKEQKTYLDATLTVLSPEGVFTTFAYVQSLATPAARRFLATLKQSFTSIEQAELIWKNVPPAVVIRCRNKKSLQ